MQLAIIEYLNTTITFVFAKLFCIYAYIYAYMCNVAQQLTKASSELADAEACQPRDRYHHEILIKINVYAQGL